MANLSNINNKFLVTTGGDVGIGVTSPGEKLDVGGNIRVRGVSATKQGVIHNSGSYFSLVSTGNTSDTTGARIWLGNNSSANAYYQNASSHYFRDLSSSIKMTLDSSGNVGIGRTPDLKILDLQSTSGLALRFYNSATFKAGIEVVTTAGQMIGASAVNDLAIRSQSNMLFSTSGNTERMRIDSSGNVGIKTTPSAWATDFSVIEMSLVGASIWASSYAANFGANIYQDTASTFKQSGASYAPSYYSQFNGAHRFYSGSNVGANTSFVPSEKMRINGNGNVGIGTDAPLTTLHVNQTNDAQVLVQGTNKMALHQDAAWNSNILLGCYYDGSNIVYGTTNRGAFKIVGLHDSTTQPQTLSIYGANGASPAGSTVTFNSVGFSQDEDGNVGIGTTSPNAKLEINSSITFSTIDTFGQLVVKAASGSTGDMLNIGVDTANSVAFIQAVERGVNTIPLLLQRYGGNVGIGTILPSNKLDVFAANNFEGIALTDSDETLWNILKSGSSVNTSYFNMFSEGVTKVRIHADNVSYFNGGNVGIGITSPGTTLQVSGSNLTHNVAACIGSGFVSNDLYHREGGLLLISGTNTTQTSAGIAFQTRNTGNTNYWKSSILMNRGGELEFYTGGAGTGQGSERMKITSGGNIQIPTDSASLQLRSSGSGAYTSIRRDAANQLIVANTAGNQVFGIGNGGELAITNGASYTTTLTYTTGWNSSYQTLIPGNSLSPNAVYIVTIKCNSFGTPPYYASTVFHIATSPSTNGSGGGNDNIAPTATHVNSTVYWKYRLSTIVNGKNGVEAYLSGGPTPNGTAIYVKATKIMTM